MPPNIQAVFFDLGDTIMEERTEIKDHMGTTISAELIPDMAEALHKLHHQGFRLALVADSRPGTPPNVLNQHGLSELFECLAISENIGSEKPDPAIFKHALDTMGIAAEDYPNVIMVGNNLERDIIGANRLGLRSVFFYANDSRRTVVQVRDETPRHTVNDADELLKLIAELSQPVAGSQIPTYRGSTEDLALAARFAPLIFFDANEPFFPQVVGYTVIKHEQQSPSFLRRIQREWRPEWEKVIEYALWWDWDIGHLYELEHVWVYLDRAGEIVWIEASSHGRYASMLLEDRSIPCEGSHPLVFSQPGKHAFSPTPHWFEIFRDTVFNETTDRAGSGGVLVKPEYARQIPKDPLVDGKVNAWLRQKAFQPTLQFTQPFKIEAEHLIPWPVLDTWIPKRVNWWIEQV